MSLGPISKKNNVVDDVIQELCNYILGGIMSGTFKKGDKIPSERELSELLNVGRSTIRESIKVLIMLGLLTIKPGQGTYIADGSDGFYSAPLSWGLIIGYKSIEEIIEVRILLESEAARLATIRCGSESMKTINEIIANMHRHLNNDDVKAFSAEDVKLHLTIAEAADNSAIYQMINTIRKLLEVWINRVLIDRDSMKITLQEHEAVYNCMRLGDANGAYEAMRKHIKAACMRLKKVSAE